MLKTYLQDIFNTAKAGDTREESYYPDLKRLLCNWCKKNKKNFLITPNPKKTEGGNPDFRILTAKKELIGYIEVKTLTVEDLDNIEDTEQLKRYLNTFPNLILTNLFEFRLYRNGQLIDKVSTGRPFIIHQLKTVPPVENQEKFYKLLEQFFSFSIPTTTTAKSLAIELAKRTRFLRDNVIAEELKEEKKEGTQILEGFYKAFKDYLITSLTVENFADLFSQTITYGLFAARFRAEGKFNRELAHKYIPSTIGILRDIFRFVSSSDLPQSMEWIIDDIAETLSAADVKTIIDNFYKEGRGKDPIIHFYETFLAEYDPKEREKRGVYYTPHSVVSYITHSIDGFLKDRFGKENGFADPSVTVLDPAAGTLTFPTEAIEMAIENYKNKYGQGGIKAFIRDHILSNFYAFELMMASYAIGHLRISFILDKFGYKLSGEERFKLYLTNTLDIEEIEQVEAEYPGLKSLSYESKTAGKVKRDIPIMIILGNPPYSGISENASVVFKTYQKGQSYKNSRGKTKTANRMLRIREKTFIGGLIEDYKCINGEPLGERNPKWIQDDYVKFFRFAQWKIEKNGKGIIGFITNHAWLDNPTFRGMRYSLLNTFDEIYILNLHGSTFKKEKTPKGGKDENVFGIKPGVAITICLKTKRETDLNKKIIYYAEKWGPRDEKLDWLQGHNTKNTDWEKLTPKEPSYFFVPKKEEGLKSYNKFIKITDIFSLNSVGVVTGRDKFVIDEDRHALEARIKDFIESDSIESIKNNYQLKDKPASRWYVKTAQQKLRKDANWENCFTKISYRPFDERWIFYHKALIERTREEVMRNFSKPNLALLAKRQQKQDFSYAFVTDEITESCVFESAYANNTVFPLYLHKTENRGGLFEQQNQNISQPNLSDKLWDYLGPDYVGHALPEDIFNYIYAILYSNIYRRKYQEFLKIDFPRIPFTKDYKLFQSLAELGKKLVDLHLLKSVELNNPATKFFGQGNDVIGISKFVDSDEVAEFHDVLVSAHWPQSGAKPDFKSKGIVVINDNKQFFGPVSKDVWNYYIGGYQVLNKWLKDRRDRILSAEEIKTYCKIATAIHHTILIQKKIDELYPEAEKNLTKITAMK